MPVRCLQSLPLVRGMTTPITPARGSRRVSKFRSCIMRKPMTQASVRGILTSLACYAERSSDDSAAWLFLGARAGAAEDGGHEIQLWTGGGHSVPGGTSNTGVWNAGLRYGWILTRPHGPGFLKGRFEYALDAVPAFWCSSLPTPPEGAGFNPLNLKWNFATPGRLVLISNSAAGPCLPTTMFPTGTNPVNFTSSAALGAHFLGDSRNWSVELRYMHISNAGLAIAIPASTRCRCVWESGSFLAAGKGNAVKDNAESKTRCASGSERSESITRRNLDSRNRLGSVAVGLGCRLWAREQPAVPAGSPPATSTPTSCWRSK